MASHLFISYAREDAKIVDGIVNKLKWKGFSVWIDRNALRFGQWSQKIDSAIAECRAMILILSSNSIKSQWVQNEVMSAKNCGKSVIPVSLSEVELPKCLRQAVGDLQYVVHDDDADISANLIVATLSELGIEPQLFDESDPDLLEAHRLFDRGEHAKSLKLYERIIVERPLHLVAVMHTVGAYYNAGAARIRREENQGIRPHNINEMVSEFWDAERIATNYVYKDTGQYDSLFKSEIWLTLGMLASFVGLYDAAFKRFYAARLSNPKDQRIQGYLDRLRDGLRNCTIEGSSKQIRSPFSFPEPGDYSTWHTIAFPFTVTFTRSEQKQFPDNLSNNWRRLWEIDYGIGQLERMNMDAEESVLHELKKACKYLESLTQTWFAELATKRIVGAIAGIKTQSARSKMPGLLPPGLSRDKACITSAFKTAVSNISDKVDRVSLVKIWNSKIDHREYLID